MQENHPHSHQSSRRTQPEQTLQDIRQMMERSSRFISLSGLSGVAAGVAALAGAWLAAQRIGCWRIEDCLFDRLLQNDKALERELFLLGLGTFLVAFAGAFIFTWIRSKKNNVPLWGIATRRLLWAVMLPLLAGAIFLFRLIQLEQYELVAPGCLVFYGLALVSGSRYTLSEVRYLGLAMILLGLINCWWIGYGLYFWAIGFGVLHILYGIVMWWKYERNHAE